MRTLLTLTVFDLVQRVRDRSLLIFALVVPLALMTVFNFIFGSTEEVDLAPVTVAVSTPAGDELGAVLVDVVRSLPEQADLEVSVDEVDAPTARSRVEDGDAGLAIVVPDGFGAAAQAGRPTTVEAVRGDGVGVEADLVLSVVDGVLEEIAAGAVTAQAGLAEGVDHQDVPALVEAATSGGPSYDLEQGRASDEQLDSGAALVAGQAGLFLLFTVGFGVNGLLAERETGTLTRLRSMPMPGWHVVASKALVSLVLGVVATAVLLTVGGFLFDADFGSLPAVAVLVLFASVAATSVMFLVARVARTSEQAGIATSIVAVVLGIMGGAFFPITATGPIAPLLDLNPVSAFLRGLGITSGGGTVADIGGPVLVMVVFAAVMALTARLVPDRGALA